MHLLNGPDEAIKFMAKGYRTAPFRYGGAVLAIFFATLLRYWLDSLVEGAGLAVFFVALVIAAWYGGVGPFMLAFALSLASFRLFFPSPPDAAPDPPARVLIGLGAFFFVGIAAAILSESARRAKQRAQLQAEAAVNQRERLRATLSCIGEAVIVADSHGQLTMMNPVAERLTGWSAEEAGGRPIEDVIRLCDELSGEVVANPFGQDFRHRIAASPVRQVVLESRDGRRLPIDYSAAPVEDQDGPSSGVVLIFRDVTQQRHAEQTLRDADRRKDEFLALLAHELRNPLAPIGNALQILEIADHDAATQTSARQTIQRQFDHLVRLVDDLLDVSRIAQGKIELRPERTSLGAVLERAIEAARPMIDHRKHELTLDVPAHPIELFVDPVRLAQVVTNLLTNAAKYMEDEGAILMSARTENDELILSVRDEGIGIPANQLSQVFDMFMQVEQGRTRSHGGLGIGLTLVKSMVQMHGGQVEAHSEGIGKGSEFKVRLQLAKLPTEEPKTFDNGIRKGRQRKNILLVDDNVEAAETLASLLRTKQYEVTTAFSGSMALALAAGLQPEVVILDLGMPGMDGYAVAERLRAAEGAEDLVILALTGWGDAAERDRTAAAGFDYHFVKPAKLEEIEFAIASGRRNLPVAANS
ncbi:MAG: ATP-binding protein [Pirellulaceae bacterium]